MGLRLASLVLPCQIVELRHVMHAGLTPARAIDGTRRHRLPATPSVLKTGKVTSRVVGSGGLAVSLML